MPRRKTNSQKPFKPGVQITHAIGSLQGLVQDTEAWKRDEPKQLRMLTTSIRQLEKLQAAASYQKTLPATRSQQQFDEFETWCLNYAGIDLKERGLRIAFVHSLDERGNQRGDHDDNATLFAIRAIAQGDLLMSIPSYLTLTSQFKPSRQSLSALATSVPAIQVNASLSLVLSLLAEAQDKSSFHKPYINMLPARLNIPFAIFNTADLLNLSPSVAASTAIDTLRAQVRDYTYIFQAVVKHHPADLPLPVLSFSNWRWAVSVIMSRQNCIGLSAASASASPSASNSQDVMALVPLWDMCNHEIGELTTSAVQHEGDMIVECHAMRSFENNTPVTMCYGNRSNIQLALFSGFVSKNNAFDVVPVSMVIAKTVPFAALKARALSKFSLSIDEVDDGWHANLDICFGDESIGLALGFALVFHMDKIDLTQFLKGHLPLQDIARAACDKRDPNLKQACNMVEKSIW